MYVVNTLDSRKTRAPVAERKHRAPGGVCTARLPRLYRVCIIISNNNNTTLAVFAESSFSISRCDIITHVCIILVGGFDGRTGK